MSVSLPQEDVPSKIEGKTTIYQYTPEQVLAYLNEKYPDMKPPTGKKKPGSGAWQVRTKPVEVPKEA